jgi:hypothetical protein
MRLDSLGVYFYHHFETTHCDVLNAVEEYISAMNKVITKQPSFPYRTHAHSKKNLTLFYCV